MCVLLLAFLKQQMLLQSTVAPSPPTCFEDKSDRMKTSQRCYLSDALSERPQSGSKFVAKIGGRGLNHIYPSDDNLSPLSCAQRHGPVITLLMCVHVLIFRLSQA